MTEFCSTISIFTPKDLNISIVANVSPEIRTFEYFETPSESDPNIIDQWDMDLSPMIETSPESFFSVFNLKVSPQIYLIMPFSSEQNCLNN